MFDFDPFDLVTFFADMPQAVPREEAEFFATSTFVKNVDGLRLELSLSAHFGDLQLELSREATGEKLLRYHLEGLERLAIERDAEGRAWLVDRAKLVQGLRLSIEPTLSIDIAAARCAE
nr:hypothetical protein [Planctomycetota bacterium]